jgi:hypothetical protein
MQYENKSSKDNVKTDADYYNNSNISNSDIGVLKKDPFLFWLTKRKKIDKLTYDHFELGTLIHLAVLEPEKFSVADITKPSGLMGVFLDHYIAAGCNEEAAKYAYEKSGFKIKYEAVKEKLKDKDIKKYLNFISSSSDKLVLTSQQKYVIDRALEGIKRNPKAVEYLLDKDADKEYFSELSLFGVVNCSNGDVKIKGKPDRIILDHTNKLIKIIDLKSTSSNPYFEVTKINQTGDPRIDYIGTGFFGSFKGFEYYRQCAFYNQLVRQNFQQFAEKYDIVNYIIPVNTTESFACSVISVTNKWTDVGYQEMMKLLYVYNRHVETQDWKSNFYYDANNGELII